MNYLRMCRLPHKVKSFGCLLDRAVSVQTRIMVRIGRTALGLIERCLERPRIDLDQRVAFLDGLALLKRDPVDLAVDAQRFSGVSFPAGLNAGSMSSICARQAANDRGCRMDELNGRMMACQILITGLIARVANDSPDPLRFLTDFRDEIKAVVRGVNISGMDNTDRVRQVAQSTVDELFSLMKAPSSD